MTMKRLLIAAFSVLAVAALGVTGSGAQTAHARATPATFTGTANGVDRSHTIDLQEGLVVVHARHSGRGNFILSLVLPTPWEDIDRRYEDEVSLINRIGEYNGGAAGRVTVAGTYILDLRASGSYEITIEQPPLSELAAPEQLEFSGTGQQVTPVIELPAGLRRITFTHDGAAPRRLGQVWLYDMAGNTVSGDLYGRLFNEQGPFEGTVELEVILEGPHLFHVSASGSWTLRID